LKKELSKPKFLLQYSPSVMLKDIPSYYKPSSCSNTVANVNGTLRCRLQNNTIISPFYLHNSHQISLASGGFPTSWIVPIYSAAFYYSRVSSKV